MDETMRDFLMVRDFSMDVLQNIKLEPNPGMI